MGFFKRFFGADLLDEATITAHGRVPIPGDAKLTFPAGKVTVTYQQRYLRSSFLRVPKELRITITGPEGGEVPIKRGLPSKASNPEGDFARQTIGSITVPTAGEYTVHTEPNLSGVGGESHAFVLFGNVP